MLAALALATAMAGPTTTELTPTDDIWVYPHASDQKDAYLRVWAVGASDLAADADEMEQVSYSYLRFDVGKVPAGKITEAKLVVTHVADPAYTQDLAKLNPLIARPVPADFTEKKWSYDTSKLLPEKGAEAIFGKGFPETIPAGKEFTITIDLLKGPKDFAAYVRKSPAIGISLSSSMDVAGNEQRPVYKFFSKDAETASKRPVLKIVTE